MYIPNYGNFEQLGGIRIGHCLWDDRLSRGELPIAALSVCHACFLRYNYLIQSLKSNEVPAVFL
jgi:hypothetical protein